MTTIANAEVKLDQWGMGAWIALMVLGFFLWWPLGLAILAYLRMERTHGLLETRSKLSRWHGAATRCGACTRPGWCRRPSSGNHAFDEYRTETLRRLEDEQREFKDSWSACASPRTRPSSTSSWRSAGIGPVRRHRRRSPDRFDVASFKPPLSRSGSGGFASRPAVERGWMSTAHDSGRACRSGLVTPR